MAIKAWSEQFDVRKTQAAVLTLKMGEAHEPLETGKGKRTASPLESPDRNTGLLTPWFQPSDTSNQESCKIINLRHFKPLSWKVMTAIENSYMAGRKGVSRETD